VKRSLRNLVLALALVLVGLAPVSVRANLLGDDALDRVLAPVALYPDSLLGNVLLAATYPSQVLSAHQWARSNPGLSLTDVADSVSNSGWDASVQALVLVPDVLAMMAGDMGWTQDMGRAFLDQTSAVYDSVQRLRKRAAAKGYLVSNDSVKVVTDEYGYVSIGSVSPNVLVVPRYRPAVVYGWDPGRVVLETALVWGTVYVLDRIFYGSCWDWHQRRFWWGPGYGACGYWNGGFRPWGYGYNWAPIHATLASRPPSWQVGMRPPGGGHHGNRPPTHHRLPPPSSGNHTGYHDGGRRPDGDRPGVGRPGHDGGRPGHDGGRRPDGDRPGVGRPGHDGGRPGHDGGRRPDGDRLGVGSVLPVSTTRPTMGTPRPGVGNGLRPDRDRPGVGNGLRPDRDRPGVGNGLRPDRDRPGVGNGLRPDRDRPGVGSSLRPDRDRPSVGSSPRPDRDRPGVGSSPRPDRDRPGVGGSPRPDRDRPDRGNSSLGSLPRPTMATPRPGFNGSLLPTPSRPDGISTPVSHSRPGYTGNSSSTTSRPRPTTGLRPDHSRPSYSGSSSSSRSRPSMGTSRPGVSGGSRSGGGRSRGRDRGND